MGKFEKFNYLFAMINYPITLQNLEKMIQEFDKTERVLFEVTLIGLRTIINPSDSIFGIESVRSSSIHNGFLILTKDELILTIYEDTSLSATFERIPLNQIINIESDIIDNPINPFNLNKGEIYLTYEINHELKKHEIRNVSKLRINKLINFIQDFAKVTV